MKPATKEARGGARKGAGRKASGRVQYVTRLRPETIASIKADALKRGVDECEIVEEALICLSG